MRVITRSWQSGPGLGLHLLSSQRSLCVHLAASTPITKISFHLAFCSVHHTHRDWCTQIHINIRRCTLIHPHHSRHFQMKGTAVMPQATGHPVLQMNTLQLHFICLFSLGPTSSQCVCVCVRFHFWLSDECTSNIRFPLKLCFWSPPTHSKLCLSITLWWGLGILAAKVTLPVGGTAQYNCCKQMGPWLRQLVAFISYQCCC